MSTPDPFAGQRALDAEVAVVERRYHAARRELVRVREHADLGVATARELDAATAETDAAWRAMSRYVSLAEAPHRGDRPDWSTPLPPGHSRCRFCLSAVPDADAAGHRIRLHGTPRRPGVVLPMTVEPARPHPPRW